MRVRLGDGTSKRLRLVVVAIAVVAAAAAGGRALLDSSAPKSGSNTTSQGNARTQSIPAKAHGSPSYGTSSAGGAGGSAAGGSTGSPVQSAPDAAAGASSASGATAGSAGSGSSSSSAGTNASSGGGATPSLEPAQAGPTLITSPVQPVGPDVVRTATLSLGVSKGAVGSDLSRIAGIATSVGGYVDSSSIAGGTSRSAPLSGKVVIRVPASDFTDIMASLSSIGHLNSDQVSGQDVTGQVAENAATITVLQQEVNLLESKLAQATQISTFLQIEGQLAPVQQQLDQLQSQQDVLQSSVALATITVNLAAPGAPVPVPSPARPQPTAVHSAWHYATHNALAVLDGMAVAVGWALPFIVLALIIWFVWTRILRRRRPTVTTA